MDDKKVTIYDVAAEAGLSIATVSRYLNKKGVVAPKSEKKIIDAIEKLHYSPDTAAQKLASGQSNAIGLLIPKGHWSGEYYSEFMSGVHKALSENSMDVLLMNYEHNVHVVEDRVIKRKNVDGLISPAVRYPDNVKYLLDKGIPFIYAGRRYDFDVDAHNVYGGFSDYRRAVADLFVKKGCRHLLVIDMNEWDSKRSQTAFQPYEEHIRIDYAYARDEGEDEIYRLIMELFAEDDKPDGIFYSNCDWTSQVYLALIACGIEIGVDCRLISTVHSRVKHVRFVPDLSVVFIDANKMGYYAGQKMLQLLRGEKPDSALTNIPFDIILNESM